MEECDGFSSRERPYLLHCGSGQGIDHAAPRICVLSVPDRRAKPASFQVRELCLMGNCLKPMLKHVQVAQAVTNMDKIVEAVA